MNLSATAYAKKYYQEHKESGLDYLTFGDWQKTYAKWMDDVLQLKGKTMLDVGCACGSTMRAFFSRGVMVDGIELNEHMIELGRRTWPEIADDLHVCDAVNMHLYNDGSFDFIHSTQVAEHWKPALVGNILGEIRRVAKPDARFFCVMDTTEFFKRHDRRPDDVGEDRTHYSIMPMEWWKEHGRIVGWQEDTESLQKLKDHESSYFKMYDWDAIVWRAA